MKKGLDYQRLSIITFSVLLGILILGGITSSVSWIGILMIAIPIVLILFAILILRSNEENKETLEEDNWYEN